MFEDIEDFVRKRMTNDASHDFEHVLRVVRMCEFIGTREGENLSILIPAAFFHDIARPLEIEDPSIDHAKESARIAREYLSNRGYPYIDEIVYAIEVHRFRNNVTPVTLEAKILQDADRLDALGAIGIYRVLVHSCIYERNIQETIRHFEEKILRLKDYMHTETAKKIATERVKIVEDFVKRLKEEAFGFPHYDLI